MAESTDSKEVKWPSVTFQTIILGANITLITSTKGPNTFIMLSVIFLLSLFILQTISRRFLLFYPVNGFMNSPTPSIDTYILSLFIMMACVNLFLGVLSYVLPSLSNFGMSLLCILPLIVLVLLILLPVYWIIHGKSCVSNRIIEKLNQIGFAFRVVCPFNEKTGKHEAAIEKHEILNFREGQITIICNECKREQKVTIPIIVGY